METTDGPASEILRRRPAPPLRPYLAGYIGYRQTGLPPGRHRGLPSPYLTVIITLGEPLVVAAHPDPRTPPGRYDTLVGGLHTAPALITHGGRQAGIQLALSPLGARWMLGLPAGELTGADIDGVQLLGAFGRELHDRLLATPSWAGRFAVLDDLLSRRLRHGPPGPVPPELARAWHRLRETAGTMDLSVLAREVGWSSRYLSRRFGVEVGLSPKAAARVVRFDRARRLLQHRAATKEGPALAALATACGYYDQAHLARDFGQFAGCAPSRWLREEFRNVQAAATATVPDSAA